MHYVYIFAIFRYSNQTPLSLSPAPSTTPSRASSSRSSSPQSKSPKKKKKANDQVDELLVAELQKEHDEAGSFGDHVAARLRRFSARQRAKACLEIDRILYDIEFPNEPVHPQPLSYPPQHLSYPPNHQGHDYTL